MITCGRCKKIKADAQFAPGRHVCKHCASLKRIVERTEGGRSWVKTTPRPPDKIIADYVCPGVE